MLDGRERPAPRASLEYLTAERLAVLAALREERITVGGPPPGADRDPGRKVDAIKTRAVDLAMARLRDLVDYTLWRVAALLLFLMLSAATLGVVGYWLTVGRRARLQP